MNIKNFFEIIKLAKEHFKDWLFIPFLFLFSNIEVRKRKGKVVGFLFYSFKKIHYLAVSKKHRSKGLGSSMIKKVISKVKYLRVHPDNKKAIRLYEKFGFKRKRMNNFWFEKRLVMSLD